MESAALQASPTGRVTVSVKEQGREAFRAWAGPGPALTACGCGDGCRCVGRSRCVCGGAGSVGPAETAAWGSAFPHLGRDFASQRPQRERLEDVEVRGLAAWFRPLCWQVCHVGLYSEVVFGKIRWEKGEVCKTPLLKLFSLKKKRGK